MLDELDTSRSATPPPAGERVVGPQGPEIRRGGQSLRGGEGERSGSSSLTPSRPDDLTHSPLFHPSPTDELAVLERLLSPDQSLPAIAARFSTTTESLILWMSLPHIAARLDTSNTALAFRARLAASSCLPSAIAALNNILTDFNQQHTATSAPTSPQSPVPVRAPSLTPELALRRNETARKAGTLLVRLSHLRPLPANATTPQRAVAPPPLPVGGGRGVGEKAARLTNAPATAIPNPNPTTPSAAHFATSSLCHSATSSPPAASPLQSEGLAVRSRGVEGGVSPTDTPGQPPVQSQSEGLLVAPTREPAHTLATTPDDNTPFLIPDRASFPDDDAWINHLAQLVGIDPAELESPNDNPDNADLPEALLANTS